MIVYFISSYINFYEQYVEFDPFNTLPEPCNPWTSDNTDFWDQEATVWVQKKLLVLHIIVMVNTCENHSVLVLV